MFTLNEKTPSNLANLLNRLYTSNQRIRLVYGDTDTGKDWLEEYDVIGTVSRSTGVNKVPLLINNARSIGGGSILDHCILKVVDVKSKRVLYQHKSYIEPNFTIEFIPSENRYGVLVYDRLQATFKTEKQAQNYIDFMLCKRMKK